MNTLLVGAFSLALARSLLALVNSLFSDSSLIAASQISSELGLAWKARERMDLVAGTSPAIHLDLAPISQRVSALGQFVTAFCSRVSSCSLVPCSFSKKAACIQIDFLEG